MSSMNTRVMKSMIIFIAFFALNQKSLAAIVEQSVDITTLEETVQQTEINVQVPLQMLLNQKEECPRLQELGKKLLNDREFCDIHLEVTDPRSNITTPICAHKSILCLRSDALKRRVREILKTHYGTSKPVLKVPDMDPDVFRNVLRYMYTDKLDSYFDLKRNVMELYVIAEFLGLPELIKMIEEYMHKKVHIRDIIGYLRWARKFKLEKIRVFILDFARVSLGISQADWYLFIDELCISAGYHRIVTQLNPLNPNVLSAQITDHSIEPIVSTINP